MDVSSQHCAVPTSPIALQTPTSCGGVGVAHISFRPHYDLHRGLSLSTDGTVPSRGMITFAKAENASGLSELNHTIPIRTRLSSDLKLTEASSGPSEPKHSQGDRSLNSSHGEVLETIGDYLNKRPLFEDGLGGGWDHMEIPDGLPQLLTEAEFFPYHRRVMGDPLDFRLVQEVSKQLDAEG